MKAVATPVHQKHEDQKTDGKQPPFAGCVTPARGDKLAGLYLAAGAGTCAPGLAAKISAQCFEQK